MDDPVGRAAKRQQHAQRILDRLLIDDALRRALPADEFHRGSAGRFRGAQTIGVHGGDRGGAGKNQPKRLGKACHGRGGAHHGAGSRGHGELALHRGNFFGVDIAGAIARPIAPAIGAGAKPLAVMAARHHRPGDESDRRAAGRHRAHELRRHGLVAAAHQHDGVHRLRAHHLLGVDRHQVAVFQAGRREKDLAERDGREFDRQRAGRQHAALHRVEQLGKVPVAIVEARRRVGDADHRLFQHGARQAHRLRERAPQIERKVAVAVVGEPVLEAAFGHGAEW